MRRLMIWLLWSILALLLLIASGLLLADRLSPRATGAPATTMPLQDAQTPIDRELTPYLATHPGQTAASLLPDGLDAFAARAASARMAGRSLDLQYYIWHDDLVGRLLGREVYAAAERGVRVRILLDDINARGLDPTLLALDAHPNIEVRLYNPFRNRSGLWRLVELVQRFFSVNHRMHNKAWIADGRAAVVGGRNIGNEYFNADQRVNFRDMDMLLLGPAVSDASAIFDDFWNSSAAVPIDALNPQTPQRLQMMVDRFAHEAAGAGAQVYLQRVAASPSARQLADHKLQPHWTANIHVASDPPTKTRRSDHGDWLQPRLLASLALTRSEVLLISPYFVPGKIGTPTLLGLVHRGARGGVITNSLAANDVPAVHSGYQNYRRRLLEGGVQLFEIRRNGPKIEQNLFGSSGASLHTKAFVLDGRRGFVGSYNLDPRSANLNTEMGVLFDDPGLAHDLRQEYLRLASPALSYQVQLGADGTLQWLDRTTQPPRVLEHEPDTSWWLRATTRVLGWLPIESQL